MLGVITGLIAGIIATVALEAFAVWVLIIRDKKEK